MTRILVRNHLLPRELAAPKIQVISQEKIDKEVAELAERVRLRQEEERKIDEEKKKVEEKILEERRKKLEKEREVKAKESAGRSDAMEVEVKMEIGVVSDPLDNIGVEKRPVESTANESDGDRMDVDE